MSDPLIFLPGMMCDARLFLPQIIALGHQRPIMVVPMTGADTIRLMAIAVLKAAPEQFALAGLSMGGMVAMEVARRAPERVTRLALMATTPLAEPPRAAAEREPQIIGAQNGRLDEVLRLAVPETCIAPGPMRGDIYRQYAEMARTLGPKVFADQSRALQRRPDLQRVLPRIKVPTLILCGAHDTLCPVKRHEFMAEMIPGAVLKVLPEAGHFVTLESPDETSAALRDWLGDSLLLT